MKGFNYVERIQLIVEAHKSMKMNNENYYNLSTLTISGECDAMLLKCFQGDMMLHGGSYKTESCAAGN